MNMDMKKAKKLFAAQQKLRACTLEHCAREEALAMKKKYQQQDPSNDFRCIQWCDNKKGVL